jgi:TRAP-type C4-dicarboxylate transport system permease large subunit
MRKRGYPGGFAAGLIAAGGTLGILLPPSITMILYAVASEQSLGRLFLAGIGPALLLVAFFAAYAAWRYAYETRKARSVHVGGGVSSALLDDEHFTLGQRFAALPRVLPFVILLTGVMIALYGGFATPSETARLEATGAAADRGDANTWRPARLGPIMVNCIRNRPCFIIGMSLFYSYVMSYLHISQVAQ